MKPSPPILGLALDRFWQTWVDDLQDAAIAVVTPEVVAQLDDLDADDGCALLLEQPHVSMQTLIDIIALMIDSCGESAVARPEKWHSLNHAYLRVKSLPAPIKTLLQQFRSKPKMSDTLPSPADKPAEPVVSEPVDTDVSMVINSRPAVIAKTQINQGFEPLGEGEKSEPCQDCKAIPPRVEDGVQVVIFVQPAIAKVRCVTRDVYVCAGHLAARGF